MQTTAESSLDSSNDRGKNRNFVKRKRKNRESSSDRRKDREFRKSVTKLTNLLIIGIKKI